MLIAEIRHHSSVFKSTDQYRQFTDIQLSTRNSYLLHEEQSEFLVNRQMPLCQSHQSHSDKLSVNTPVTWFPPKISRVALPPSFTEVSAIILQFLPLNSEGGTRTGSSQILDISFSAPLTSASLLYASKLHAHGPTG